MEGKQGQESRESVPDERLVDEITALEWEQFQNVKNEGGRASCQDDHKTFEIMRKSQFLAWDRASAESYLDDLKQAWGEGWNLLAEKYARMMESTAPKRYRELAGRLPARGETRRRLEEELIRQIVEWEEDFQKRYPGLAGRGRKLHTSEDTEYETSFETYARGEMGTYSDRTIERYAELIRGLKEEGESLSDRIMERMVRYYGYRSLDEAERAYTIR